MSAQSDLVWSVSIGPEDSYYVADRRTGIPSSDVPIGIEVDSDDQCDGCGGSTFQTVEPVPGAPLVACDSCGDTYSILLRSAASVVFP